MVDVIETTIEDTAAGAEETIRIPRNIMALLRESYDTREKALDWILALVVCSALVWAFRDELTTMFWGDTGPNAGTDPEPQPNQNLGSAFPNAGPSGGRWPALYAYNMPVSRNIRNSAGPSATSPPGNPSLPPSYP
jgi:hypothetical protein